MSEDGGGEKGARADKGGKTKTSEIVDGRPVEYISARRFPHTMVSQTSRFRTEDEVDQKTFPKVSKPRIKHNDLKEFRCQVSCEAFQSTGHTECQSSLSKLQGYDATKRQARAPSDTIHKGDIWGLQEVLSISPSSIVESVDPVSTGGKSPVRIYLLSQWDN